MPPLTALTEFCGSHCVATRNDGPHLFVIHCETCHYIMGSYFAARDRHLAESEARPNERTSG